MPSPVPAANYLQALMSLVGTPYLWGGKSPDKDGGLDCSGACTYALFLAGGPDLRQTHNAARLYAECFHTDGLEVGPGDLAFYGAPGGPASHVMTVVSPMPSQAGVVVPVPNWSVFGATGGNHSTLTVEIAQKQGARVQHRKAIRYRPDLLKTGRWIRLLYP